MITIIGGKQICAAFAALDTAMQTDIAGDIVNATAEQVSDIAAEKAPRDTGRLASNISISDEHQEKDGPSRDVGPNEKIFYGRFVELGTSKMSALPFLRPALEDPRARVAGQAALARRIAGLGT